MVRGDLIIKIYRRLAKKRYLRGKHTYEYERIYVPIPSRLHDIVRPFLNQRLKNTIHSELNICALSLLRTGEPIGLRDVVIAGSIENPRRQPKTPNKKTPKQLYNYIFFSNPP